MKKAKVLFIICMSILLISIVALSGCTLVTDAINSAGSTPGSVIGRHEIDIENMQDPSIAEVVANNCLDSIVMVTATNSISPFGSSGSLGSGFFVNENGYLITNSHVVEGHTSFIITTVEKNPDGTSIMTNKQNASLLCHDPELDLAILKLGSAKPVNYLTFAKEDSVAYGQSCYTIGNPNGLMFTMTSLMIANPSHKINGDDLAPYAHIVLDGNINHGNSGGALINAKSKVIGVVDARIEGNTPNKTNDVYGIGLAIPSKVVKDYLKANNVKFYVEEDQVTA